MNEKEQELWTKYVRLVAGMAHDELLNKGPTHEAFVANLKLISDNMKAILDGHEHIERP